MIRCEEPRALIMGMESFLLKDESSPSSPLMDFQLYARSET